MRRDRSAGGWVAAAANIGRAWASLRNSPVYAATAVGTLTLGISATVATFSLVYGVLLAPLPYAAPDRLVAVWPERNFNAAMIRETAARTDGEAADTLPALRDVETAFERLRNRFEGDTCRPANRRAPIDADQPAAPGTVSA